MKIICIGDSLTYGFGVPRPQTWVRLAADNSGHTIINRGISGDTTGGMLARFRPDVINERPNMVIILGGSNDIFITQETAGAKANISAMAHQALAYNIKPVIASPLPVDLGNARRDWGLLADYAASQKLSLQYRMWLHNFAEVFNIHYLDLWEAFMVANQDKADPELYSDGLHPNPKGHLRIAEIVSSFLKSTFAK